LKISPAVIEEENMNMISVFKRLRRLEQDVELLIERVGSLTRSIAAEDERMNNVSKEVWKEIKLIRDRLGTLVRDLNMEYQCTEEKVIPAKCRFVKTKRR
jgi:hypothetical protein